MGETTVRPAGPDDADGIARVHTTAWQTAYRGVLPDDFLDGLSPSRRAGAWRRALLGREGAVHVAVDGTEVVGFAATGPARDDDLRGRGFVELQAVYVDPARWGSGIGFALLGAALADAGPVVLWVLADNPGARRFYERAGFAPDGTTRTGTIGGRDVAEVRYARTAAAGIAGAAP
ncbi:GNAT family N-acetyltransferase [Saccharothrix syringae]|uniref:GNAT family N-acetyltransferase n=1 Tax=Saccharothrix syringae TaxID=103733 RepID=A0A5Q0GVS9_SACSY|nr:GNAT family N-acetyltransferase [Saccharothrix syringae]QFZ18226.1 GNAT family N-acetyltransferase [Saccharothrix syringae]